MGEPLHRSRFVETRGLPELGAAVVALTFALIGVPAAAQDVDLASNGIVDMPDEVGPGECTPGVVGVEEVVSCRFPLVNPQDKIPEWGIRAITSVTDEPPFWDEHYRESRCYSESGWLVCPDLLPAWEEGVQGVFLDLNYDVPYAEIEVDRIDDSVVGIYGTPGRVASTFVGHAIRIGVYRSFLLDVQEEASLVIRRDGSDQVVASFPALQPGEEESEVDVTFPEPGRWTVSGCWVDGNGGCVREGFRRAFDVIEPDAMELVPGHNLEGADRINVLFVGSGWRGETDAFVAAARLILSLDGHPIRQNELGLVADPDEQAISLEWGPFSIEPLRGNAHLFNFWYLGPDVDPAAFHRDTMLSGGIDLSPLELGPHVAVVIMSRTDAFSSVTATAELPTFQDVVEVTDSATIEFGSTTLPYTFGGGYGATTFSHEVGHLLFGLADEYMVPGISDPRFGYPNCAEDVEQAEEWWGDLAGDIDPMYTRWVETEKAEGTWWYQEDPVADFTVGFIEGGCFADSSNVIRPTVGGLMNREEPVFGSVNRQRAEQVLSLWTGRAMFNPVQHGDELSMSCRIEGSPPEANLLCSGTVHPYLDPPGATTLEVSSGTARSHADCDWTETTIECDAVAVDPGVVVTPVLQAGEHTIELAEMAVPVPTTTTTTTTTTTAPTTTVAAAPAPQTGDDGGDIEPWLLVAGAAVVVLLVTVTAARRRADEL